MATLDNNTKEETTTPRPCLDKYSSMPEAYMQMPTNKEIDIDALNCCLKRAEAVCMMLGSNFNGLSGTTFNDEILANAVWALEGYINQAHILANGN